MIYVRKKKANHQQNYTFVLFIEYSLPLFFPLFFPPSIVSNPFLFGLFRRTLNFDPVPRLRGDQRRKSCNRFSKRRVTWRCRPVARTCSEQMKDNVSRVFLRQIYFSILLLFFIPYLHIASLNNKHTFF
jgi:hypothetical protein